MSFCQTLFRIFRTFTIIMISYHAALQYILPLYNSHSLQHHFYAFRKMAAAKRLHCTVWLKKLGETSLSKQCNLNSDFHCGISAQTSIVVSQLRLPLWYLRSDFHCGIFENGVLLMYTLEGTSSVANFITAY